MAYDTIFETTKETFFSDFVIYITLNFHINSPDTYTEAVKESRIAGIDEMTDPSDTDLDEKLKKSRSNRATKYTKIGQPARKRIRAVIPEYGDEDAMLEDSELTQNTLNGEMTEQVDGMLEPIEPPIIPPTLNIHNNETQHSK